MTLSETLQLNMMCNKFISSKTAKWLKDHNIHDFSMSFTVYVVYFVKALVWQFGKSRIYHQIKCMPFRL